MMINKQMSFGTYYLKGVHDAKRKKVNRNISHIPHCNVGIFLCQYVVRNFRRFPLVSEDESNNFI